jgi:hypothetical protein
VRHVFAAAVACREADYLVTFTLRNAHSAMVIGPSTPEATRNP